ncbi:MAG: aminotransferase class III-fold pyridoxal phosphate-dependent enzyme, partial [Gemmatimonadota bacterium]
TGRPGVAAFTGGYHGLSYGALRATARAEFRGPFAEALGAPTLRLPFPDPYRPPIDTAPHRLAEACLEVARRELRAGARRGSLPGAIVVEPVQGREGVIVPPEGWLRELAALSREAGTLLVLDEVLTGFGRTGAWFAVQREGVVPDVLVLGKGMAGGMPVAAAVAAGALFSVWERPGEALHTSTFLAHPLACAAALAALEVLERERLVERAAAWEATLGTDLRRLAIRRGVGDVRGRGMMWAVELVRHPPAGRGAVPGGPATPDPQAAGALVAACLQRGVLVLAGGSHGNVLQVTPPLVLSADEWAFALEALQDALAECE